MFLRLACGIALGAVLTGATSATAQRKVLMTDAQTGFVRTDSDSGDRATRFAEPPGEVWRALTAVYESLKIEPEIIDSVHGQVGHTRLRAMRRFAGQPISTWLNCGTGITGDHANEYRIEMYLVSHVSPTGIGASVTTSFQAIATDIVGSGRDRISCGSTGRLETLIRDKLASTLTIMAR